MANTTTDLFRLGNAGSPRLDNVREGKDIEVEERDDGKWVKKNGGGVSTFSVASGKKNEWKLASGSAYDGGLIAIVNDHGNHWNWEPAKDMKLTDFVAALTGMNGSFVKQS